MLKTWLKQLYWPLILPTLGLICVGTLFIYSASYHDSGNYMQRHMVWAVFGLISLFAIPLIGYRSLLSISYLIYAVSMVALVAVFVIGQERLGAQRWISLGPVIIQPSELAKLATILAMAHFLGEHHRFERKSGVLLAALCFAGLPFILILKQPDLGTAILFLPMIFVFVFLWGIRYRTLILTVLSGVMAMPFFWHILKEYQKKRILTFLDPSKDPLGAGYTAIQSKIAVGSGGLFGKGYLQGTQSQLQFVPEHHTDFIFCVMGEEWGYFGALLLLIFYALLFHAAFQVIEKTTDMRAKLLIAGIVVMLFSQVFINIAMSIGLMPVTGLTLPLISYGGSSLVVTCIALGLILSVYRERSIF